MNKQFRTRPRQKESLFLKISIIAWLVLFFGMMVATGWVGRLGAGTINPGLLALIWLACVLIGWPVVLVVIVLLDQGMERGGAEEKFRKGAVEQHLMGVEEKLANLPPKAQVCFVAAAIERHLSGVLALSVDGMRGHGALLSDYLNEVWAWLDGVPLSPGVLAERERWSKLQETAEDQADYFDWEPDGYLDQKTQEFYVEINDLLQSLGRAEPMSGLYGYGSCFSTIADILAASENARANGRRVSTLGFELIEHEIDRQRADLEQLSEGIDLSTFATIRERARSRSVIQSNWMTTSEFMEVAAAVGQAVLIR